MYTQDPTTQITEGMEVYDKDGSRIGTVKAFRLGEGTINSQGVDVVTKSEIISQTLGQRDLPTILYERLYSDGFICVDRGFLRSDVVIFMNQIMEVTGEAIFLDVYKDELISI